MMMNFKPNPKKQVELKFVELFGRDHKVTVMGTRLTPEQARRAGLRCMSRDGVYFTEVIVDGEQVVTASERDWRKSYKSLKIAVESLYADGLSLA